MSGGENADAKVSELPRKCPICGRATTEEHFPFCSKRCADIDLNRWLSGVYAVPAEEAGKDADEDD